MFESSDRRCEKFGAFPSEIRYLIWKHALPGPRIIHVQYIPVESENEEECRSIYTCSERAPAILHVNKESRKFASKHYMPAFGRLLSAAVFFDFSIDTLSFGPANMTSYQRANLDHTIHFTDFECKSLRYIAVSDDITTGLADNWDSLFKFRAMIEAFSRLENMVIVLDFTLQYAAKENVIGHKASVPLQHELDIDQYERGDYIDFHKNECHQLFYQLSKPFTIVGPRNWLSQRRLNKQDLSGLPDLGEY